MRFHPKTLSTRPIGYPIGSGGVFLFRYCWRSQCTFSTQLTCTSFLRLCCTRLLVLIYSSFFTWPRHDQKQCTLIQMPLELSCSQSWQKRVTESKFSSAFIIVVSTFLIQTDWTSVINPASLSPVTLEYSASLGCFTYWKPKLLQEGD